MKKLFALLLITVNIYSQTVTVSRGPYLQQASPNSIIIKWLTNTATTTKVNYGTSLSNLTQVATNTVSSTKHEIKLTGLLPYTKYFYSISSITSTLVAEAPDLFFRTMPNYGQKGDYRFWVIGDAGEATSNQPLVRDAFLNYNGTKNIDGWIWLGDNAYDGGFGSEYQANVFSNNTYGNVLKNTVVWPAAGNHDYNNHIPFSPSPAYLDIFSLPANGECGGVPSGSEKYYSYNYGNIHFIVLESFDVSRSATGTMATWLKNDLNANTQPWVIAYWHHPPYTKGSHNSDNTTLVDWELVDMRENIIPILEAKGVDLILNGHSHVYERSYLIDGHYGYSIQLQPSMIKDNTSGNYPTSCAYNKQTQTTSAHKGTVYAVCGCSAKNDATPSSGWPHPVMHKYTNTLYGSMAIDVNDNKLEGKFITSTGSVFDSFTIIKNAGGVKSYSVCANESLVLKPTVPGGVNWFPNNIKSDSITITPQSNTTYYTTDLAGCIKDTFHVSVVLDPSCVTGIENITHTPFLLYPNYINTSTNDLTIESAYNILVNIELIDLNGKKIMSEKINLKEGKNKLSLPIYRSSGLYFITISSDTYKKTYKVYAE